MTRIRPAQLDDRSAIADIAYATAFFGAAADTFFPDRTSFTGLWVTPYLDGSGCCNFVAEDDGVIVGYVVGSCDPRAYRRHLARALPRILARILRNAPAQRAAPARYLLRLLRHRVPGAPAAEFPAHLHLNVITTSRGAGLGAALLERHLACLHTRDVRGVQLSTTRENAVAVHLYETFGFTVAREQSSPLWQPWLGRDAIHLVMTRRL